MSIHSLQMSAALRSTPLPGFLFLLFIPVDHFAAVSHSGAGGFPQALFQSNIFFSSLLQLCAMLGFLFSLEAEF